MRGFIAIAISAAWFAIASIPLQAHASDEAERARLLAAGCTGCHGTNGQAQVGGNVLARIDRNYFISQMKAFKSGQRAATVMHQLSKGYTDADIEVLATFFSSQRRQGGGS